MNGYIICGKRGNCGRSRIAKSIIFMANSKQPEKDTKRIAELEYEVKQLKERLAAQEE